MVSRKLVFFRLCDSIYIMDVKNSIKHLDTKIPIPTPDFLKNIPHPDEIPNPGGNLSKHEKAFDQFCYWSSLPQSERRPRTLTAFENKYKLPKGATHRFRRNKTFREKTLAYFWEWAMDKFPDVVEAIYKGAIKGNSAQAKTFSELVAKHMNVDAPVKTIQPIMLVGVDQSKINKLFVSPEYKNVEEILPEGSEK